MNILTNKALTPWLWSLVLFLYGAVAGLAIVVVIALWLEWR